MPEVDVEEPACMLLDHVVTCVTISNSKDVGGGALSSTRFDKVLVILLSVDSHHLGLKLVLPQALDIIKDGILLERSAPVPIAFVNGGNLDGVVDEFDVANHISRLKNIVGNHL